MGKRGWEIEEREFDLSKDVAKWQIKELKFSRRNKYYWLILLDLVYLDIRFEVLRDELGCATGDYLTIDNIGEKFIETV